MYELGIADAAESIAGRQISSAELIDALLARIGRIEPAIHAWVSIYEVEARADAKVADATPRSRRGPLHGVPLGIKDIVDIAGQPTGGGFAPFAKNIAEQDATIVQRLREAGAIILGKTVTTQFAYMDPPITRNPWNPERTPGGSSSGSGASVAARMVSGAIGSQTGGSILRPAAYNGVVGLKPTFGRVSRAGVFPLAWSVDHLGPIARSVVDVALILQVIAGHDPRDRSSSHLPVHDYVAATKSAASPRLLLLDDFVERADPETQVLFAKTMNQLEAAGATVVHGQFPGGAALLIAVHSVIMLAETATVHRRLEQSLGAFYSPRVRAYAQSGALISAVDYLDAQRIRGRFRDEAAALFASVDALVLPSVVSAAPGTDSTGDSSFQSPFSLLGLPAVSLPSALSAEGMPLGVQFVSPAFAESQLLATAAWVESVLGRFPCPPKFA